MDAAAEARRAGAMPLPDLAIVKARRYQAAPVPGTAGLAGNTGSDHPAPKYGATEVMMSLTNLPAGRLAAVCLVAATALAGCVSKSDYNAVQAQNAQLEQKVATEQQRVTRLQNAIKYTVNSDQLFPSGSWTMSARGKNIIAGFAKKLAPTQENKLLVTGFTDDRPVGKGLMAKGVTSNEILSQKRADAVRDYLISQGVNPDLVTAQGLGDANPVASNATPAGRAKNRRVELSLAGSSN